MEQLKNKLPECAKDIKLNMMSVLTEEGASGLNQQQIYAIALASAYATKSSLVIAAILAEGKDVLTPNAIEAAKSAAIIMAMNNVYYRFTHLISDKSYAKLPAKLRMNIIANPGVDKIDFELNCFAVSSISGCGLCMDSHAQALAKAGITVQGIQSAVRIAAVINAVVLAVDIENLT